MKRCKVCKSAFEPRSPMQVVCGWQCAAEWTLKQKAKKEAKARLEDKRQDRAKRERLKTRSDWIKDAQTICNRFIRARDAGRPCICCGLPLDSDGPGGSFDAGHYRSVGSAPHLRFHPDNIHGQRKVCNRYGAGRAVDYRRGLIARIGIERVEALENDQTPRKYTIEELKEIIADFKAKIKELSTT